MLKLIRLRYACFICQRTFRDAAALERHWEKCQ